MDGTAPLDELLTVDDTARIDLDDGKGKDRADIFGITLLL
jgi:hypothetical protein